MPSPVPMSEYATLPDTTRLLLEPRTYWRISAFALAATALLGIVLNAIGQGALLAPFLAFDWTHNVVHAALAGAAFLFGFGRVPATAVRAFAVVFGIVYGALGILGLFVADLGILHLELGENLVHIVLSAWALAAGLTGKA